MMGRLFPLALLAMAGCAEVQEGTEALVTHVSAPIKDGYIDGEDKAVVGILHAATGSLCTGTLIAPNVVLTARHCVSNIVAGAEGVQCALTSFEPVQAGPGFFVTTADELTLGSAGEFFGAIVVGLAGVPGVPPHVADDTPFCGQDVAIIVLDENVPADKATPYVPRLEDDLEAGEPYSAVGYGGEDDDGTGSGTRRRRDDLAVTCIGTPCFDLSVIPEGEMTDEEWVGGGGVCRGDSGGPALDAQNRVIGVTSRGTVGCGLSLYGQIAPFSQWLKNTVVYASGRGLYEAPAWTEGATVDPEHSMPIGQVCSDGSDCPSGRCIEEGSRRYCTRACTDEGPCPDGWSCGDRGGTDVCIEPRPAPLGYTRAPSNEGCQTSGAGDPGWLFALASLLLVTRPARQRRRA